MQFNIAIHSSIDGRKYKVRIRIWYLPPGLTILPPSPGTPGYPISEPGHVSPIDGLLIYLST